MNFPYESQWGDLACNEPLIERGTNPATLFNWRGEGYPSEESYVLWARNICGLACFRSVLRGWVPERGTVPMFELITGAERYGALVREGDDIRGLYYKPFLDWVKADFGIAGQMRLDNTADEMLRLVSPEQVVLASVSAEIRYPDRVNARRGGHLVLVHGFDGRYVTFHNPSGVPGSAVNCRLPIDRFERFYANRGVTLRRSSGN